MSYLQQLLQTPLKEFSPLDAIAALALSVIVVQIVLGLLTVLEILVEKWRGW